MKYKIGIHDIFSSDRFCFTLNNKDGVLAVSNKAIAEKLNLDESSYVRRVFKVVDCIDDIQNNSGLVVFMPKGKITNGILLENFYKEFEKELILLNLGGD